MYRKFLKTFHNLRRSRRGNATLIVALGMPALIGGTGFAVDTAQWYMWKREMQHSVDQAAIAGAWALSQDVDSNTYQARALQEFNANQGITDGFDTQPSVRKASWAGGDENSVVVSVTASRRLPFSSFITNSGVTIRATAQASFAQGASYNACLVAIAEDGVGTSIGGNATVKAQCGLAALSCDDDAIQIAGSATVHTDSIVACGGVSAPDDNEDVVTEDLGPGVLSDYYEGLEPPDDEQSREYKCVSSGKGNSKITLASPESGTYVGGISVKCRTVFAGGVYVIDGGTLDLTGNFNVTGNNVMFVLKNGARLKLGGSGNGNSLNLTPMTSSDFVGTAYEANADKLAGMLVFEDPSNELADKGSDGKDHIINGNSNSLIEGTIYLPSNVARVNGTADIASQCLQISAYRIKVLGNANLETLCPSASSTSVGNALAKVRLVA